MMEMRKDITNVKHVRFNDYSLYESGKSNNGGCYGFWCDYIKIDNDQFELHFGTTSDMEYCPVCGHFANHSADEEDEDGYHSGYTCGEFEIISFKELMEKINSFKENDNKFIEFYF